MYWKRLLAVLQTRRVKAELRSSAGTAYAKYQRISAKAGKSVFDRKEFKLGL